MKTCCKTADAKLPEQRCMVRLGNQFVSFPYKMKLIQSIFNSDEGKEGSQKAFWESYLLKIFNLPFSLRQDFE